MGTVAAFHCHKSWQKTSGMTERATSQNCVGEKERILSENLLNKRNYSWKKYAEAIHKIQVRCGKV